MRDVGRAGRRDQVLAAVADGVTSTAELAMVLGVSETTARDHLRTLEADGLVVHRGPRMGPGSRWRATTAAGSEVERTFLPDRCARLDREIASVTAYLDTLRAMRAALGD